jgi:glycosyltransferase XagB
VRGDESIDNAWAKAQDLGRFSFASREAANDQPDLDTAIRLERAVERLRRQWPLLSAGVPLWRWQALAMTVVVLALMIGQWFGFGAAVMAVLAIPFLSAAILKIYAVLHGFQCATSNVPEHTAPMFLADVLPRYSVLVPLFREPDVAADLIDALKAIDYPPGRLQILLILETGDAATALALALLDLPPDISIITVPAGQPQTKPRALNYAVQSATGEFVVVYDAEDMPAPNQLRLAAAAFARAPETACFQACLHIYNADSSWLTRQFALEYAALFDWILPALQHAHLPVPLGGTSNHFRRDILIEAGAWDPFNVTEDADLGIRFARLGLKVEVLRSSTLEEAPHTFRNWLPQRTRWLKGWMQTYAVHMRQPDVLWRDLGPRAFLGFHMLFGGMMLSALVHPWFYIAAAYEASAGRLPVVPLGWPYAAVWWVGVLNLVAGYAAGAILAGAAAARLGQPHLIKALSLLPIYWLMVSIAAYRALFQAIWAPYRWEKTAHAARTPPPEP